MKWKIKSSSIIYTDFKIILIPEDNGKQNPDESYTNKHQEHLLTVMAINHDCVTDNFSKPFKS